MCRNITSITTTDSVADDFTEELQEEVIWRGGDTEHDVCHGGQCRDVLRKLAAFREVFLELKGIVRIAGRFRRSPDGQKRRRLGTARLDLLGRRVPESAWSLRYSAT